MNSHLISIATYCNVHDVDDQFISELENFGLLTITVHEQQNYIDEEQLRELELFTRWRNLGINAEGMEALYHVVSRMKELQQELNLLRSKINWYEQGGTGTEF